MLADITASATMSLNDSHGNIIAAIRDAYENRVPLESGMTVSGTGFGLANTVRMGPGSDDTGTPVYSINQVFANTLFDSEGRIVAIYVDQLEYATPNYDGSTMPHFSGWPGQGGYNNDANHDARSRAGSRSATAATATSWAPAPGPSRWTPSRSSSSA